MLLPTLPAGGLPPLLHSVRPLYPRTPHTNATPSSPRAELATERYKLFVQVTVAEAKGQGLRVASRALWDAGADVLASETLSTDAVVAVATVHAVYMP